MYQRSLWLAGWVALAVAVQAGSARAQVNPGPQNAKWPDTYAGRWAKAYLKAYNDADAKGAMRRFIQEHYSEVALQKNPLGQELAGHLQLRKVAGKVRVHTASAIGEFGVDAVANAENLGWVKFRFLFSPDPPHDPTRIGPVAPASPPDQPKPEEYRGWKDLEDLLEKVRRDAAAPAMAAAIVRGGKTVEQAVTGLRRLDRPGSVRIDSRFHLGSVTKTFTATMIGKLVEQGVLRWDMTIGEVLDDVPMRRAFRSETLERLLQHRGGVPNLPCTGEFADGFPVESKRSPAEARAALVRRVLTEKPVKPGVYCYSNAGYVVAASIAERVAKRSWEEMMRRLVFEPLGLRSAGFGWPATRDRTDQPLGHLGAPPDLRVQEIGEYGLGDINYVGPAGNLHCSIEDLARYAAFHLRVLRGADRALKAATVQRFWRSSKTATDGRAFFAFGSGGSFLAMVALYPECDLAVVAAANYGTAGLPFFKRMRDAVLRRYTSGRPPRARTVRLDRAARPGS